MVALLSSKASILDSVDACQRLHTLATFALMDLSQIHSARQILRLAAKLSLLPPFRQQRKHATKIWHLTQLRPAFRLFVDVQVLPYLAQFVLKEIKLGIPKN